MWTFQKASFWIQISSEVLEAVFVDDDVDLSFRGCFCGWCRSKWKYHYLFSIFYVCVLKKSIFKKSLLFGHYMVTFCEHVIHQYKQIYGCYGVFWTLQLQHKHLLASSMLCPKCSSGCRIVPRKGNFSWRCPRKGCQTVVSIRQNSFYTSGSHLPLTNCIEMTYYRSPQQPVTMTMIEAGHSSHTVVDWYNFHRDVCALVK